MLNLVPNLSVNNPSRQCAGTKFTEYAPPESQHAPNNQQNTPYRLLDVPIQPRYAPPLPQNALNEPQFSSLPRQHALTLG